MKTQAQIYDSLYHAPIAKAALHACLDLKREIAKCSVPQLRDYHLRRYDAIRKRFRIADLLVDWSYAQPINQCQSMAGSGNS